MQFQLLRLRIGEGGLLVVQVCCCLLLSLPFHIVGIYIHVLSLAIPSVYQETIQLTQAFNAHHTHQIESNFKKIVQNRFQNIPLYHKHSPLLHPFCPQNPIIQVPPHFNEGHCILHKSGALRMKKECPHNVHVFMVFPQASESSPKKVSCNLIVQFFEDRIPKVLIQHIQPGTSHLLDVNKSRRLCKAFNMIPEALKKQAVDIIIYLPNIKHGHQLYK